DQTVRLWDQLTGKELHRFHGGSLPHAVFSPDGSRLAYIDVNHQIERVIFLIETAGGKVIGKIKSPAQLNSLALSADNRTVICSSYDKKIYVMEQAPGQARLVLTADKYPGHVVLSPDGVTLAAATHEDVHLFDLISGKELASWPAPETYATLTFSPTGTTLVA